MRYRNPVLREAPAQAKDGREFIVLLGGVLVLVGVGLTILSVLADQLAPHIPFELERRIANSLPDLIPDGKRDARALRRQEAIVELAGRVARAMDLPAEMGIRAHYVDMPVVNAMATLGGDIHVYRGLLDRLESEDALAAVLAHEIAHVRQRHVARALGRSVVLASGLTLVGLNSQGINRWLLDKSLQVGALNYSREAETEADELALRALHRLYGHAAGLEALFRVFDSEGGKGGVEFLRTHPLTMNRISQLRSQAARDGIPTKGELRPLPDELASKRATHTPRPSTEPAAIEDQLVQ